MRKIEIWFVVGIGHSWLGPDGWADDIKDATPFMTQDAARMAGFQTENAGKGPAWVHRREWRIPSRLTKRQKDLMARLPTKTDSPEVTKLENYGLVRTQADGMTYVTAKGKVALLAEKEKG